MLKEILFSSIQGLILLNGAPIENAQVTQIIEEENGKTQTYETTTDNMGQFNFPVRDRIKSVSFFPKEFVIAQRINVKYKSEDYILWSNTKRDTRENSEIGEPLILIFKLDNDLYVTKEFGSILRTRASLEKTQ